MNKFFLFVVFSCLFIHSNAQTTRINDYNTIGWFVYNGTFKLSSKWGIHTDYQWRRENIVTTWQQSLLRLGVNYQVHPKLQLRLGYAWAETYAYGDIPLQSFGKTFTEHRSYQMATITDKLGRFDLSHRFMLEQRWIGRFNSPASVTEDNFFFVNRLRYLYRMQLPLQGNTVDNKEPYVAAYDEIAIGFGKNVAENIFDQNRIGILIGYRFSNTVRIEGAYFNQILQLGREVNGRNVFQYNKGLIVNTVFNFGTGKKRS
jgi:Protein of unknown function (DUF2490)